MGMREVVLAALIGALIVIAAVAVPALALESPGFHAVVYPVALALFVPYAWLTLPAVLKEGHEMTALYALFVSMAIATVWAIGELSGRSIGRMRLIVLEGALVSVMALSFASVLISLGVTNTLILSSPLAVAAMIYIVAALVGIVPPEGVEAGISDNAATASIPSNIEVETIISRDEEKEQTQTPPSVENHENLPTICIENAEEETPSIPAIVVPEEAEEEPVPAINCEAEAPATAEEAAITEEPLLIAEEEAPAPVVIEEEPIPAEPAIIAEKEAIPAEAVAIIEEETIPAESAPAEEIVIEEPVEEVLIEEEPAIIEPEVIAEAVIEEPSPAEEIAEPVIAEEEEIIPVEEDEPALVEEAEPAIIEEEPASIAAIEEDVIQIPRPPAITVSSRLSVPTAPTLTNTAKLEEPKVPSAPSLSNTAELVEETYQPARADIFEDDFWSTFYIAGQDTLQLEDGEYFMDLIINEAYVGVISTVIENGKASINSSELSSYLTDTLTEAAKDRIFFDSSRYISLETLEECGVSTSFNTDTFEIGLTFNPTDMPVQILSIRGISRRAASRPIAGAIDLDPVTFMWGARYQLTASLNDVTASDLQKQLSFSLYSSNFTRLFDVHLDFSYYLNFSLTDIDFRLSSYKFYMDFPDEMIRLSWGEVGSNLLSPSGQGIGIRFDKSLAYAGTWARSSRNSHVEQLVLIDKTSEIEVFNEGQSIYKKTLEPGSYRLQDFILYSGANRILIRITPIDGSPAREIEFDVLYSGSLLAPGETYYGASFVFGRNIVSANRNKASSVVSLPLWGNRRIDYDVRDVVLSGYIRTGLSETFTLDATLALQNDPDVDIDWRPNISFAAELTQASILGTTRYNLNVDEKSDDRARFTIPVFDFRIGHQISTGITGLSTISFGASYQTPEDWNFNNYNQLSANIGMAGSFGRFGWSLSGYGTVDFSDLSDYTWSVSAGISLTASKNVYLSASMNVYDNKWITPTVSGRIGATIRFKSADLSANTGFSDISVRASYSDSRNSFSTTLRSYDPLNIHRYDWNAAYSYSGDYVSAGVNVNSYDTFDRIGLSANISTSTLFADGLFAISSYIPSNFLLIRQYGALKGNDISIGSPGSSSFEDVPSTFGTSLYTSIPVYNDTSLMIYSTGDDQFDATESTAINLRAASRDGYVLRLSADETYSVSGIVTLSDGTLWTNQASPLYKVSVGEDGSILTEQFDSYIFTDNDGRFIMSGLVPGMYGFDVRVGSEWILAVFTVDEGGYPDLQLQGAPIISTEYSIPAPYAQMIQFNHERNISADDFFALLYPEMTEVAV